MLIIGNNKSRIGSKSTIHEFVVILVGINQMQAEIGIDKFHVAAFQQ